MGRVNAQRRNGDWFVTFHRPNGSSEVLMHVPVCELGPLTAKYLKAHEAAINGGANADLPR
jgi:hypothetical protein